MAWRLTALASADCPRRSISLRRPGAKALRLPLVAIALAGTPLAAALMVAALMVAAPSGRAAGTGPAATGGAVIGGARALPLAEALERSREAAETVLSRGGQESCLRGKLTLALVGLSASCAAQNDPSAVCALAHRAAVRTGWTLAFMDSTALELLELLRTGSAPAGATPAAAVPQRPSAVAPTAGGVPTAGSAAP